MLLLEELDRLHRFSSWRCAWHRRIETRPGINCASRMPSEGVSVS
jgi:hypothetical protein